jgi:ferrous iron transport protein B
VKKTWFRLRDFVRVALPITLFGSFFMGALFETGYLWVLNTPLSPVTVGLLGLPAVAGLSLILGILRKELALELLVALAIIQYGQSASNLLTFMTPAQIFTYALVVTIYFPCTATAAVLGKELGWKNALLIMAFTILLAMLVGAAAIRLTPLIGLT